MRQRLCRFIATIVFTGLLGAVPPFAGHAGEVKLPDDIRVITATDATSDCIGKTDTPVCAVETLLACTARADNDLCLRAKAPFFPHHPVEKRTLPFFYRIESICFDWSDEPYIWEQSPPGEFRLNAFIAVRIVNFYDDLYHHDVLKVGDEWKVGDTNPDGEVGALETCATEPPPRP